jgi:hypothetical protein
MSDALEKRAVWQTAENWLTRWGKDGEILDEADKVHDIMTCLNWGSDVSALGVSCPKHNLTWLLSDNWLDDEIIDMSMYNLAACVRLNPELVRATLLS